MDTVGEKISIIHRICEIQDNDLLDFVKNILEVPRQSQSDWCDDISESEQVSIQRGLLDLQRGNLTGHDEVKKKYERWLQD